MKKITKWFVKLILSFAAWLRQLVAWLSGPSIISISPVTEYAGSVVEITGNNFSVLREDNAVTIGTTACRVIEATGSSLKCIVPYNALTGKIGVTVSGKTASSAWDFNVKPYPVPGSEEDGPPILYQGESPAPSSGDVPPTGNLNVLVVLVNPTDIVPGNPANSRTEVVNKWANVTTFYNQATYNTLNVAVTVTAGWKTLFGSSADYVDSSAAVQNIKSAMLPRLMAECAQHAVDDGVDLNNFQMIACVIFLNGMFIRAWGGTATSSFMFIDAGLGANINLATTNPINELWIQESANWGRFAHETGHNIVAAPSSVSALAVWGSNTLGEDIYFSDLVDGSVATAEDFDIMGNHDTHPIFSAYHLERTGWVGALNILNLSWDRNPFSNEYEVVAHGLVQNGAAGRYHIIKIKVADGLFYYIEVRQRPPMGSVQIFDDSIPLDVATHAGGVIVTKVFTDLVNNNQQMRFISLLHDPHVLSINQIAVDPARNLTITVINDNVATDPLVCRVRVEWAQAIGDDPGGQFDLRLEPWDSNYQTPDIWIDRNPFGSFDQPMDAEGRPQGNGDKPRPHEVNEFFARVHNDGAIAVTDVLVTFYAVDPPGVGDNGNWSPLTTRTIANINNNDKVDIFVNWVPVVGEHTCLKVYVQQQLGEITGGNNSAQENVFDFEAPAASVPAAVYIPVAVRNPLKKRSIVHMGLTGVKYGYIAQFPHAWVWLDALEEKKFILTVVPTLDYPVYQQFGKRENHPDYAAYINLTGYIPREYSDEIPVTGLPASKLLKIGGIMSKVKPKKRVDISLWQDKEHAGKLMATMRGSISSPVAGQRIRIDMSSPIAEPIYAIAMTDGLGRYSASVNFYNSFKSAVDRGVVRDEAEFLLQLKAIAQAFVLAATEVAEVASNQVLLVM